MLNSGKKFRALRDKKNKYSNSRVVRKKTILNETKNHNPPPPPFKLNGRSLMSIRQKSSYFYQLDQHILEQVKTNPYLGLKISDDLKWSSHTSKITSKASCTLGFLRRNLRQCSQECKKWAYLAMVRSTLEYGCLIWDPYTNKNIDKLESIQESRTFHQAWL